MAAAIRVQPPAASRRAAAEPGRDPFRLREAPEARRPPGLRGVAVLEAEVRGVLLRAAAGTEASVGAAHRAFVILESPSGEGFVATPGARLMDGALDRIHPDGATFLLADDRDREVFRPLSAAEARNGGRRP